MAISDWIGQAFRDYTGMPPKVSSYDNKIKIYDEIKDDIDNIEKSTIDYFNEICFVDWKIIEAKEIKLEADLKKGLVLPLDYPRLFQALAYERDYVLDDFISNTDKYFVIAYKNRLYSIKNRNGSDPYIEPMEFDDWFSLKEARELAKLAALQIRSSDKYIDAKKIAEISQKYKRDRHIRKGMR